MTLPISFPWTPSAARTAVVLEASGTPLRGITVAQPALSWPGKSPSEVLDYALNLDEWLAEISDNLIETSVVISRSPSSPPAPPATDMAVLWSTIISGRPVLMLTGGNPGVTYLVAISLATSGGRRARFVIAHQASTDDTAATPLTPVPITFGKEQLVLDNGSALEVAPGMPLLVAGGSSLLQGPVTLSPNVAMLDARHALVLDDGTPLIIA